MDFGRAALVLAGSSAFLACAQISGLSGLGFGSGGSSGDSSTSGGGASSSRGGAAGTGGLGGAGGQGQGGGSPSATGTSSNSAMSASTSASTGPTSSAMSSTSTGALPCKGGDPGVCCPLDHCANTCCHTNQAWTCQTAKCDSTQIRCDSSSDCNGGTICCGDYDGNDFSMGIRCQATCTHPATPNTPGNYEICSLTNPVCITGGVCNQAIALPDDYGFCF